MAIGHTGATPAQVADAVSAGATLSTHLGNGCAQMLPRHPNVIWEQLATTACCQLHRGRAPPAARDREGDDPREDAAAVVLVTDAMAAAGMPPGRYTLGGQEVELAPSGRVAVPGAPNLAGSALRLDVAIGNTVRFAGVTLDEAVAMASTRPAEYVGLPTAGKVVAEWDPAASTLRVVQVVA